MDPFGGACLRHLVGRMRWKTGCKQLSWGVLWDQDRYLRVLAEARASPGTRYLETDMGD